MSIREFLTDRRHSPTWRWWMLLGYWSLQLLCIVALHWLPSISTGTEEGTWQHWLGGAIGVIGIAFLGGLPILPALWLAMAREAWWKRPIVALGLMLSLEYAMWVHRTTDRPREYWGDDSLFIWLPFGVASVVLCLLALIGRWRTSNVYDQRESGAPQFALRDMFIATAVVAACVPIGQSIYLSYMRESKQFLDGLEKVIAMMMALVVYTPAALVQGSLSRMLLGTGRPNVASQITLAIGLIWFVVLAVMIATRGSEGEAEELPLFVLGFFSFMLQVKVLGLLLRWLGYRVTSAWRVSSQRPEGTLSSNGG